MVKLVLDTGDIDASQGVETGAGCRRLGLVWRAFTHASRAIYFGVLKLLSEGSGKKKAAPKGG